LQPAGRIDQKARQTPYFRGCRESPLPIKFGNATLMKR
jgi:hypothetical protein